MGRERDKRSGAAASGAVRIRRAVRAASAAVPAQASRGPAAGACATCASCAYEKCGLHTSTQCEKTRQRLYQVINFFMFY